MSQLSDTSGNTGLLQLCEQKLFGDNAFGSITNDTSRKQIFTNYINAGLNQYINKVITLDGIWQIDDTNYTDYAIATTDIVSGQSDYVFSATFIKILSIEILDSTGHWKVVPEVDEAEFARANRSLTETYSISGEVTAFNRNANSIFLLPTPNYSAAGGIKIRYQRPPSYFVYTDTTKTPGIPSVHHDYLVDYACWKYSSDKAMSVAKKYELDIALWHKETIPSLYYQRTESTKKGMRPNRQNNR